MGGGTPRSGTRDSDNRGQADRNETIANPALVLPAPAVSPHVLGHRSVLAPSNLPIRARSATYPRRYLKVSGSSFSDALNRCIEPQRSRLLSRLPGASGTARLGSQEMRREPFRGIRTT